MNGSKDFGVLTLTAAALGQGEHRQGETRRGLKKGRNQMLLHLEPRLLWPYRKAAILDLLIEPFGLWLVGGVHLATCKPYPNKHWKVACRKNQRRKVFTGILIELPDAADTWRMTARWCVEDALVVTHRVDYRLIDRDFDAASDNESFWGATWPPVGGWPDRTPCPALEQSPPQMEVLPREYEERQKPVTYRDTLNRDGTLIVERSQAFAMPTIEGGRLMKGEFSSRIPPLDAAFRVAAVTTAENSGALPSHPARPEMSPGRERRALLSVKRK